MTKAFGRVIAPPALNLRTPTGKLTVITVDEQKCQWNIFGKSVVEGKPLQRWALIDFTSLESYRLNPDVFVQKLRNRCRDLGVRAEEPLVRRFTGMRAFSSVNMIQQLLESVVKEANDKWKARLQLIVCVMPGEDHRIKYLKWVSETQIGVLTQCCLVRQANKDNNDQYLANVGLKINAKLGGSNVELNGQLSGLEGEEHVMFVGAAVNHPGAYNATCPSMAAVVATINWPAANRYAARICSQRKEKILNFGAMCLDLVNTYAHFNKVRPRRIVVFRDGVSDAQFDMVLNEELLDLKRAIYEENYHPTITVIVAQKRHQTRLFLENESDGGASGNVPPGTVVDTKIVHPFHFDFYLCSHYGLLGTSKPCHYYVLYDDHNFTSDQLQKLTYDLCFTSARCTKPISVVPPVYYADLAAYRGRMFQEVAMELQPAASVSSSSSITSSSALLEERFYKLHPDIQNEMFFV
ncbi:Protein argonaute-2 [Sarracenia purpurea var. burkii]